MNETNQGRALNILASLGLAEYPALAREIAAELDAAEQRGAETERQRAIEAVTGEANRLRLDSSESYYQGYKCAIYNALAALRASKWRMEVV